MLKLRDCFLMIFYDKGVLVLISFMDEEKSLEQFTIIKKSSELERGIMMFKFSHISVGLVLLLMCATNAYGKKKQIGIFPFQSVERSLPKRELETLSNQFVSQLEQSGLHKIIKRYPLAGGLQPPTRTALWVEKKRIALIAINQIMQQSVAFIKAGEFEKAIPPLKKGISKTVASIKWKESFPALTRMCGLLALSYLQLGRNDEGEFLLKALAVIAPKPLPPEIRKNRIMLFRYGRTRRDIKSIPRGSIHIDGTTGATVFMDGKNQGTIPITVKGLAQGIHYLQIQSKKHIPWGKALRIKAGTYKVKIYLQQIKQPKLSALEKARREMITSIQLLNLEHKDFHAATKVICEKMQIKTLLAGNLKKANRQYLLTPIRINCATNKLSIFEPIQLDGELLETESKLRQMGVALLAPKKIEKRPPPRRHLVAVINRKPPVRRGGTTPIPHHKATPIHKAWWFWTIVGVTVAGAGAATTIVLLQPPHVAVTATWSMR